jgi:hypothetical protein
MKKHYSLIISLWSIIFFNACKTDDIAPKKPVSSGHMVTLTTTNNNILEAGGSTIVKVELSIASTNDVEVKLAYTGTAIFNKDYSSNLSITIPAGSLSNTTSLLSLQDTAKEGNEQVIIDIDSVIGSIENGVQTVSITIEDDDVPAPINLIFNEILYDPGATVVDGDANGDGIRDANQDEFIELYNNSSKPIDLSGYKIFDADALLKDSAKHTIPNGTILQPNKVLVIFGGGTPTGVFGGATVQKASSGDLNLTNAGDFITIKDASNNVVLTIDIEPWSNNPDESYTRSPDITGDFVQHATAEPTKKFSPGTKLNGSPF